ncbi:MAG: hypothetical protein AAF311_16425 [Pseudomonadota bacterium]
MAGDLRGKSGAFDRILVVDWSAANAPVTGADSIWIADSDAPTRNPPTRAAAMMRVGAAIEATLERDERLLIGWDFAFGYPAGFAGALGLRGWRGVWAHIHAHVRDGADNRSNRFEVAAAMNRALGDAPGPFWGHSRAAPPPGLRAKRYLSDADRVWPFEDFAYLRAVERRLPAASPVFKLAYTGSVGSQTLLGITRLEGLRRAWPGRIAVWPFQTDFAADLSAPVVLAEIYPSAHDVPDGPDVKDRRQVEAVLRDFVAWNADGSLRTRLAAPGLSGAAREAVRCEEGWVVGL